MSAPAWVLLHYFGGSALSWRPLAAALGEPCVMPDLRGFGGALPGGGMAVADYADDAAALVQPGQPSRARPRAGSAGIRPWRS